jgi:6,7-dimethyl-8-ribityllumazine synthase
MRVKKVLKKNKNLLSARFAVVVSRFNPDITGGLLEACLNEFIRLKVAVSDVQVVYVPGAFEIPVTALKLAEKKNIEAVICLGAVIRGETLHYELVAGAAAQGIMEVALRTAKPVIFEILAADTVQLCEARARTGDGENKGASAARTAVEMVDSLRNV